jgi:6-phosphogluconolactonase (cycloisomerase 2 family)
MTPHLLARTTAVAGLALAAGVVAATAASAAPATPAAHAAHTGRHHDAGAVFVQNDALAGNAVVAYHRAPDGSLRQTGVYPTGGLGGKLTGAVVDNTASQGALTADREHGRLLAVNAGSDSISVFRVHGDRLQLRQVVSSGGSFPVSVTASGDVVYVLNARDGGSLQGYRDVGGRLVAIRGWHRELGLPVTTGAQEFTHTPGQVLFTPDGRHLVGTTKAATNSLLVFGVSRSGRIAEQPVVRAEDGTVPFAGVFDAYGRLAVGDAGTNSVATYRVGRDGTLTRLGVAPTGQAATCWVAANGTLVTASNAGSASVTTLRTDRSGAITKITDTSTGPGTIDAAFTPDGDNLYVQTGATGAVDAFSVASDGALTKIGSVTVPDAAGGEGIVAW